MIHDITFNIHGDTMIQTSILHIVNCKFIFILKIIQTNDGRNEKRQGCCAAITSELRGM